MTYSAERKAAVLKKMLPPNNVPLRRLSQDEGISEATLHSWRKKARDKGQLLPDADAGPEGWSSRDKFAAVIETAAMNAAELSEYCWPNALAWSPDDKYIVAGTSTVQVSEAANGRSVLTYREHSLGRLLAVAWSPDGKHIASSAADRTVRIW